MTEPTELAVPQRCLAIGAHPDDIEFGCGATLAKWARAGCEVHLYVLTDGSKGTWDVAHDLGELVATRQHEQRAAAEILGARDVHFGPFVDGELETTLAGRAAVCEVIRATRPDVVFAHDPWKQYRLHPDHRHGGWLALDGIVAARDPHFFPAQTYPSHRPHTVLLFEAEVVDHVEHIDGTDLTAKTDALLAHHSQWRSTHGIDTNPDVELPAFVDRIRQSVTQPDGGLGESFHRLTDI